jgi:DnaK suppressor protein
MPESTEGAVREAMSPAQVSEGGGHVKAQEMENFKRKLLDMRRELLSQVERSKLYSKEIGEDGIPDSGDVAAYSYSKEVLMGLGENERAKLRLVEEALAKIDEGVYGVCERCEGSIPVKRLERGPLEQLQLQELFGRRALWIVSCETGRAELAPIGCHCLQEAF